MRLVRLSGILAVFTCGASTLHAQDSVGQTPGQGDALSAYGAQRLRYVVDLVPLTSSWGNEFLIAPIAKASEDSDPGFNTNRLAAAAASADVRTLVPIPVSQFSYWTAAGEGVHPTNNAPPSQASITAASFDRLYTFAFNDLSVTQTNVVGLEVGYRLTNPARLFITRTVAATSRSAPMNVDHSTLSLGSVDADGSVMMRVDDFTTASMNMQKAVGESIVRVSLRTRDEGITNTISALDAMSNQASDPSATEFIINAGSVTTNPPSMIPQETNDSDDPISLLLDFAGNSTIGANPPSTDHLPPGIIAHRGNPTYSAAHAPQDPFGGTMAYLGRSLAGSGRIESIGVVRFNTDASIFDTERVTLPGTISDGPFSATDAEFTQHQNQTSFRGGNGPVAIGLDEDGDLMVSATASALGDEFIVVATIGEVSTEWRIAAFPNKPVLDGPTGQQIGRLATASEIASPVALSAPAMDLLGNVYFVGAYKPNLGAATVALFKAALTGDGYVLERLLSKGEIFVGANSTRPYEIISLALADSNSLSSGALCGGSIIQQRHPGAMAQSVDPLAMGALLVNAVIRYDNNSTPEDYDAVLYISPRPDSILLGDLDGDGVVGAVDLAELIGLWGSNDPRADLDSDGEVGAVDLAILIGSWSE